MEIVNPLSFSSGALSISSTLFGTAFPYFDKQRRIAALSVVFP
jgi:hypothetical protein